MLRGLTVKLGLRRQLDEKLRRLAPWAPGLRPRGGWIRTIRDSLGMSVRQLARRMGVSHVGVVRMEAGEQAGTVSLDTLRRAADAMDCELVYFFLPRQGLEAAIQAQATKKAAEMVAKVSHSMALEAQGTSEREQQDQVRELALHLTREAGRRLWDDESS